MTLSFDDNEIKESRRLRNAVRSGNIQLNDIRKFFESFQRKTEVATAGASENKLEKESKGSRVNHYRNKLKRVA